MNYGIPGKRPLISAASISVYSAYSVVFHHGISVRHGRSAKQLLRHFRAGEFLIRALKDFEFPGTTSRP